ncbi:MAG: UDP-glucose 4-epimerase GalE, partial [Treponema sp.]|nr:UDP-glucose 4-epimerase GalE [Treponema sp.]
FDNLFSGLRKNLFSEADFIHGDIQYYPDLFRAAVGKSDRLQDGRLQDGKDGSAKSAARSGYDAIIHLAAFKAAGESMLKPEKYSVNNINGTVNILNVAAETGIPNIVFSSSAAVYGEPAYLPIDEQHPTNPENYYGFTKLEIERFLNWYDKIRGIKFAALRYFNAAGYDIKGRITGLEQNPANLVPVIMEGAAGMRGEIQIFGDDYDTADGTCIRDYIHVSDLAIGHAAALDYLVKNRKSLIVNLGSERGFSVLEILETARKVSGKPIPAKVVGRRPGDPAKLTASAKFAHEILGWTAKYSDPETLIKTTWKVYNKP